LKTNNKPMLKKIVLFNTQLNINLKLIIMKTLITYYFFRFDHFFLFTKTEVMKEGIMKVQDSCCRVGDDFSVYLPHECWSKVRTLEDSFIAYDLGKIMKVMKRT
jgi:hypothetical protein